MTLRAFLDGLKAIGFFDTDDGRGFEALRLDLEDGSYLLVTNDDFSIPHEPPVVVGLYDRDDRQLKAGMYQTLRGAYGGVLRLQRVGQVGKVRRAG